MSHGTTHLIIIPIYPSLKALPQNLLSSSTRMLVNTDNVGLFHSLLNKSSDSVHVEKIIKQVYDIFDKLSININFKFISGANNPADAYSRSRHGAAF